ncbi:hypothetical protein B4U80_01324 [Leptotrombidium deliense]|uniref:Uncharacterized protein n=1 Tax=Leptotrombidium deliense TaxID=299467 RepID=A0A443SR92_9ACAR|nr:hypothetical protein B4U80_01324 [Leptotrombidium deliense]
MTIYIENTYKIVTKKILYLQQEKIDANVGTNFAIRRRVPFINIMFHWENSLSRFFLKKKAFDECFAEKCPAAEDGTERFACPSADKLGRYRCIDDHVLCDGYIDCPNAEDEDRMSCMFFKTSVLAEANGF